MIQVLHMQLRWPILKKLKDVEQYLSQFHSSHRAAQFEKLIGEAFSCILYLPFYMLNNDDQRIRYKLTWQGNNDGQQSSKAPEGSPDAVARCYDFDLIIEATQSVGANQWVREFAPSTRHCDDYAAQNGIEVRKIPIILIAPEIHRDTYQSIHHHPSQDYIFVPMEVPTVIKILVNSILAFTLKHVELRRLLNEMVDCFRRTTSLAAFKRAMDDLLVKWQKEVLNRERNTIIGVKSYEAMLRIGRKHIGAGEIFNRLQKHPTVLRYFALLEDKISIGIVEDGLLQQGLAYELSQTYDGERVFSPVPFIDFKKRGLRVIGSVESINR